MSASSQDNPPARGFFISHMVDHIFGTGWRKVVSHVPDASDEAHRWMHPQLLDPRVVTAIRHQFYGDSRVAHVCLSDALKPDVAAQIYADLQTAQFVRHHHTHYPLWIAPRPKQKACLLSAFMDWLATREAAIYHSWLVRWPHPVPAQLMIQVQTSRMDVGDQFPLHMDTEEEGIAVVYNMTAGWDAAWGGVLKFLHPHTGQDELVVPPHFNSVMIFRPQNAPHLVSPVQPEAVGHYRYTITVFYTYPLK